MSTQKTKLFVAIYLMEICYGLFLLIASLLASSVIANNFVLGLTGTLHVCTRVVGNAIFGRLSDRIGRKRLLLIACALFALAFVVLRAPAIGAIFLAYFIAGVGNSIFWPLIEAWIGHGEKDAELLRFLGTFGVIFTIGTATGNLLGGFFEKIAPVVSTAVGLALLLLIGLIIAGTHEVVSPPAVHTGTGPADGRRGDKAHYLWIAWIANFATWAVIGLQRFMLTKLCLGLGISKPAIGAINALLYSSWAVAFMALIIYRRWTYRFGPLAAFQALGAAAVFLIWVRPSPATLIPGFALFGVSASMTYLSSMFYGQDGSADLGNKSGLHEMILGLGMLAGPLIGGALAQIFEIRTPFLFAAGMILAAMVAEGAVLAKSRSRGMRAGIPGMAG